MGDWKRVLGREDGASAVEFALVVSLLFMVLFGTVQFGIAFNRYQGLTAAAREGGRLASIRATDDEVVARTKEATSIIDTTGTTYSNACGALAVEASCIDIAVLNTGGTYVAYATNDAFTPCDRAQDVNDGNPTVRVRMVYRMRIQIPFVGNLTPTITGESHFRCEL